ncbi:hypothetical protein ACIG47_03245 [Promicromonospora sp. NPDC052451]
MTRIGVDTGTPHSATLALTLLWISAAALPLPGPGIHRLAQVSP